MAAQEQQAMPEVNPPPRLSPAEVRGVATAVETMLAKVPLKPSRSTSPEIPEMEPVELTCQTFQTPEPQTSQLVQVLQGVPV